MRRQRRASIASLFPWLAIKPRPTVAPLDPLKTLRFEAALHRSNKPRPFWAT